MHRSLQWIVMAASGAVFGVEACFFELSEPVDPVGTGGAVLADAAAGSAASPVGIGGAGGANDASALSCAADEKPCGSPPKCVRMDEPLFGCSSNDCLPCIVPNATASCNGGACSVKACTHGFGDCDGDPSNGCETDFDADWPRAVGLADEPIPATRFSAAPDVDGRGNEWEGFARQPLAATCPECTQQYPMAPVLDPSVPPPEDLTAWLRAGWDPDYLYVLVEVRDDDLVDDTAIGDAGALGSAFSQDAVELLLNANNSRERFYDYDDRQLFFALDGAVAWPNKDAEFTGANRSVVARGTGCYTLEARMSWLYLTARARTQAQASDLIGFVAAVNDWDRRSPDGGGGIQRQSHLFSRDPKDQYWSYTNDFGSVLLEP